MREQRLKLYELPDYRPRIGRHNDYGYNVAEQKTQTFTGMGFDINVHDQWAVESQGRIQDRTREHLGTTDKAIVAYRRMLLSAIGQVANGEQAADVARRQRAAAIRGPSRSTAWARPRAGKPTGRMSTPRRRSGSSWAADTVPLRWSRNRMHLGRDARASGPRTARPPTREAERRIRRASSSVVRLSFADQHGILRGKTLVAGEIDAALKNGVGFTTTMLLKDTSHRTVFPVWHAGRRLRHEGAGRRGRRDDAARSRRPSACCPGRRIPAGCCATSSSPTAGRCRSARATSCARTLVGAGRARATTSSPGSKSSSICSSWRRPSSAPAMPASRASRPTCRCSTRATST